MPAVELHDPLLHLLLVRQQLVVPQEVSVCYVVIVADLRCGSWRRNENVSFFLPAGTIYVHCVDRSNKMLNGHIILNLIS